MAFTAGAVLGRASVVLLDASHTRWPLPELLLWLNDGVREIAIHKPTAVAQNIPIALVLGSRQTLPAGAFLLIRPIRNLESGALSPRVGGRIVNMVSRQSLDAINPSWHESPPILEVRNVVADAMDPKTFYVWPPNTGTGFIEALVAVLPTDVAEPASPTLLASYTAEVGIPDDYQGILLDYVLYRAFSKESDAGSLQRALGHYQIFANALGIKAQRQSTANANTMHSVPVPGVPQPST